MGSMKKISLIASHSDIVNIISELLYLECIEPVDPILTLDPPELTSLVRRDIMELEPFGANMESIVLLATQYTYTLVGWLPVQYESEVTSMLSGFTCSWHIEDPRPEEIENVPILIKHPQLFGSLRSGGRRVFEPLTKIQSL